MPPGARSSPPIRRETEPAQRPEDAILAALAALHVPERERRAELRAQLARLPGWASQVKWRTEHPDQAPHPADLVDYLAMRLAYEAALVEAAAAATLPAGTAGLRALVAASLTDQPPGPRSWRRRRGRGHGRGAGRGARADPGRRARLGLAGRV
jgi:hypothetical protein